MKVTVSIEGFKELDYALSQLPKSVQKATLVRTLKKAAEPIADRARQLAPKKTGQLRKSISVSAKLKNSTGRKEYREAMLAGMGEAFARKALRDARRADPNRSFAVMYVGPSIEGMHGHLIEFGTSRTSPQPFMRPAWEAEKDNALAIIRRELANEIIMTARRVAKSSRRGTVDKYRASVAAMLAHEVLK